MSSIYRVYTSDDSFQRFRKLSAVSREMHVVLAFAKNGEFSVYFEDNNNNVTPTNIANFKQTSSSTVNFFLCIGDHTQSQRYPFFMADKWRWISNATMSLQRIIQQYGFNGIDVCYPKIEANADDFVDAIGTVIDNLIKHRIITMASISPSPSVNNSHYVPLYNKFYYNFDYVVYQTHDDEPNNNNAEGLVDVFKKLTSVYPKEKLLPGHNILPDDWVNVPYPVVLRDGVLAQLLKDDIIQGASVWALTKES